MKFFFLELIFISGLFFSFGGVEEAQAYSMNDAMKQHAEAITGDEKDVRSILPSFMPHANGEIELKGDEKDITLLIQKVIDVIVGLAGVIAVLFIVYNGFVIAVAGSTDKLTNAKNGLMWAGIGLILIIFAYVVAKTVISFTYLGEEVSGIEDNEE